MVAALALAKAFGDAATGITPWIDQVAEPIMEEYSPFVFGMLAVFCQLLTNIASNTGTLALFTPIAYTIASSVGGIGMEPLMMCILLTGCLGIFTLPASVSSAYLFGQKEWFSGSTIMKYGHPPTTFPLTVEIMY